MEDGKRPDAGLLPPWEIRKAYGERAPKVLDMFAGGRAIPLVMEPLGLSANALATALHVPTNRITAILTAMRRVSADTALRLARYFGTTPQLWMNLQSNYDLQLTETKVGNRIRAEIATRPMAGA